MKEFLQGYATCSRKRSLLLLFTKHMPYVSKTIMPRLRSLLHTSHVLVALFFKFWFCLRLKLRFLHKFSFQVYFNRLQ